MIRGCGRQKTLRDQRTNSRTKNTGWRTDTGGRAVQGSKRLGRKDGGMGIVKNDGESRAGVWGYSSWGIRVTCRRVHLEKHHRLDSVHEGLMDARTQNTVPKSSPSSPQSEVAALFIRPSISRRSSLEFSIKSSEAPIFSNVSIVCKIADFASSYLPCWRQS